MMKKYGASVSLQYTWYNVEEVCVSTRRMDFYRGVSIENHYGSNGFFW